MKLRQMCGGGTWKREDLTRLRRPGRSVVWDFVGWGLLEEPAGPLRIRFNGRFRDALHERRTDWVYRAGWPDRMSESPRPVRVKRLWRTDQGTWLRLGPWVVGSTRAWDESGSP